MDTQLSLQSTPFWTNPWIIATILFGVPLCKFTVLILSTLVKQFLPMWQIMQRYCDKDKESWVVVTGATDGIGLGFCEVLAKMGFNIVLISRNTEKLQKTIENLQKFKTNPQSKLKAITFNFKQSASLQASTLMLQELKQLDIAILVNNVGTSTLKNFHDLSYEQIVEMININCVSMAVVTNYVLKMMAKRNKKSAIINLSSFMGEGALPYVTLYAATKAFNKQFSNGISLEYAKFIDIMCLKPMFVQSTLSQQKKGFNVPDRRQCAWDTLKELRWQSQTYGYFSHRITAFILKNFIPDFVYRFFVKTQIKRTLKSLFPSAKLE